jgi:hypothetical protein
MHGEHEAKRSRIHGLNVFKKFEAVFIRQCQVNNHKIRLMLPDGNQAITGISGLGTDIETFFTADQLGKPVTHDGVVIDEQQPLHARFRRWGSF